jgi:hypothetical protein
MTNIFDRFWSTLELEPQTGRDFGLKARTLLEHVAGVETLLDLSGGPPVVYWLKERDLLRFLLHIRVDAPYFEGHFPGNPILPGIIQLHWAVQLARHCLGIEAPPGEFRRIKFQSILVPPRLVELRLRTEDRRQVEFQVLGKSESHSSGVMVFPGRS